jgi:hypothetical protein
VDRLKAVSSAVHLAGIEGAWARDTVMHHPRDDLTATYQMPGTGIDVGLSGRLFSAAIPTSRAAQRYGRG